MPQLVSFRFDIVKAVFAEHGIYALQEFPDGQINWGNEPLTTPYNGLFHFADFFTAGRYDIFTIRAILSKLDKAGAQSTIEKALFESIQDDEYEEHDSEAQPR